MGDILKEVTCKPNLKDEEERGVFLAAWRSGEQEITALHWGKFSRPGTYGMSRRLARE